MAINIKQDEIQSKGISIRAVAIARKYAKKLASRIRENVKDKKPEIKVRTTNNMQRRKSKYMQSDVVSATLDLNN